MNEDRIEEKFNEIKKKIEQTFASLEDEVKIKVERAKEETIKKLGS
jgi:hypothetical protein